LSVVFKLPHNIKRLIILFPAHHNAFTKTSQNQQFALQYVQRAWEMINRPEENRVSQLFVKAQKTPESDYLQNADAI
jgi:alcohol dehydrogenase YqhD (iron-dependent ADH family)